MQKIGVRSRNTTFCKFYSDIPSRVDSPAAGILLLLVQKQNQEKDTRAT